MLRRISLVLALPLVLALLALTQDRRREASLNLIAREYAKAVKLLDAEIRALEADPTRARKEGADRLLFLLAGARLQSGDQKGAARDFARLEKDYPQSAYRYLARFGRAKSLARGRAFQEASSVYQKEVARLLSSARRVALSETYLGLVEQRLGQDPVDRRGAIQFLDLARGLELPRDKDRELSLRAARLAFDAKDWRQAAKRFQDLVVRLRGDVFEDRTGIGSMHDERLWLARSWRRSGNVTAARRLLEDLLREGMKDGATALLELAWCHGVPKRTAGSVRGIDVLQRFLTRYPQHEKAPEAAYLLAKTQINLGRLDAGLKTLDLILDRYADRSDDQIAQAGADRGLVLGHLERWDDAIAAWKGYLSRFPAHGRWMDAQRALVDLELQKANATRERGKASFDAAAQLYRTFLTAHPLDRRAPSIYLTLGQMEEKRERFEEARKIYQRAVGKYRGTREASDAAYRVGRLLETKLFNYSEALAAYRKVTGPFKGQAQQRIAVLKKKSLTLRTERVYRTDETPKIRIVSRNIPKLRVRVYKLDIETFFRGTLGRGSIDRLAVEVISPDKSFDASVKEYVPHRETESDVAIPFKGAGAYVVKVDDQEFEATTLVLVSDLALISKASRNELFVFTENTRENRPQASARIFVTDGTKVVAEGVTDARGSYRLRGKKVRAAGRLHVFARGSDGSAATTLNLSGLRIAQGLVAKSFVYTDRSVYRPGETCSVKAVVRDVQNGVYVIPKDKAHVLDWIDGQGRVLQSRSLEVGEFGTLAARFDVPELARPGTFSLRLRTKQSGRVLATAYARVAEFQPPRVSLQIEAGRTVLVRGERIEGKVVGRYFFGGPVAGSRVEVTTNIGGRRVLRGTTDKAGEFAFSFETTALTSGTAIGVQATMPSEQATTGETFRIQDTEFALTASLKSKVFLVGDDLEVEVTAKSHDGKPLGRKIEAALYRLVTERGRVQELPVATRKLETDGKTGVGFAHFSVAKSGNHRVRVWAVDRLENRIEARQELFVSGKDDDVKLRVLSGVQHGKVGDTVTLRVVNRVGPKLCLITTEGDGVLAFETRVFPEGETKVDLELSELHAPNFAWAVAIAADKALHTARKDFVVARPLQVKVKPAADRLEPGGKLALELEATDSRGKPVAAEFSVAIVDQAILDLFPDSSPDLYQVFYGPSVRRVTDTRTASSSTFSYKAATRRVNAELKAEEVRSELEKALRAERQAWSAASDDFVMGRGLKRRSAADKKTRALAEKLRRLEDREAAKFADAIGLGGGAGGKYGGRAAGRRGPAMRQGVQGQAAGLQLFDARQRFQGFAHGLSRSSLTLANPNALAAGSAQDEPRTLASDPAVFRAAVTTGTDGRGRVEIDMPARDGSWQIRVRGVTADSLVGEGKGAVVTARELLVKPALPAVLTEGDAPRGRLTVHNLRDEQLRVHWTIKDGDAEPVSGDLRVAGKTRGERSFTVSTKRLGERELRYRVTAGNLHDALIARTEVRPWAVEERTAESGRLAGERTIRLTLPEGRSYRSKQLVIDLGPDIADELFPIDPIKWRSRLSDNFPLWAAPTHANRAASGLAALALYEHWAKVKPQAHAALAKLRVRIEGTIAAVESIESGGEVRWIGRRGKGAQDPRSSLLADRFLVRARAAGFVVDAGVLQRFRSRNSTWLRSRDLDTATLAFLVTAEAKRADFARFNTLYRARQGLSMKAAGQLALAALAMHRPGLVTGLVADLATKLQRVFKRGPASDLKRRHVYEPEVESALWALLAVAKAKGHDAVVEAGVSWLHARRRPRGWTNAMTTALAVELMAGRETRADALAASVAIDVNGRFRQAVDFRTNSRHRHIVVDPKHIVAGENRITLRTSGRGKVIWSTLLTGLTSDVPKSSTTDGYVPLRRRYYQAPAVLDGRVLPEGFRCVDSNVKHWENLATEVAVGGSIRAKIEFRPTTKHAKSIGSFVLEEPLPAGAVVLPTEIAGNYDAVEIGRGFLRFFVHKSRRRLDVNYTLRGFVAGDYRVLPTRVYSLDNPSVAVYGGAAKVRVLDAGSEPSDARRASPDELEARGLRLFDRLSNNDLAKNAAARAAAEAPLAKLWTEFGDHLRDRNFREVARRLLRISLAKNDNTRTVALFEALKDRDENYVLGFADMFKVGDAYYRSGEFERALVVYEAICETSFLKEVQIAGTLDRVGEIKASVKFMHDLFYSFPGLPTVRGAMYALAQSLNKRAGELSSAAAVDPKVGSKIELARTARNLCYEYLLRYPGDGDAGEVTFTLASVALEAEQLDEGIELLQLAQRAYPTSTWLDDFVYLEGYAWFLKGDQAKALALLERVATEDFPAGGGRKAKSDSRWLAIFIEGQIHHAAGNPELALQKYTEVEKRFPDAREAADYFRKRRLALPEVSIVKPGQKTAVKLTYRNLKSLDLTVYKVDLMRLYLMRKSLSDMGNVELFGIAPVHEKKIALETGEDYIDHELDLAVPAKESGAYLVLVRSGELKSSGLMLQTSLKLEVQELASEGRIRVNVKKNGVFLPKAIVKVVGDRDGKIRTGRTDLRGIFVADGLQGRATVLAKVDDSYAFFRGSQQLGAPPAPQQRRKGKSLKSKRGRVRFDALFENRARNFSIQNKSQQQLESLYKNAQKGVEIRRAK